MRDVYRCGRNTSFVWTHESPDNPEAILPSCSSATPPLNNEHCSKFAIFIAYSGLVTERHRRQTEEFEIQASLHVNCSEQVREQVAREVMAQLVNRTQHIDCFASGSCVLRRPEVSGCEGRVRRKRFVREAIDEVRVKISVRHNPKPGKTPSHLEGHA